MQSGTNGMHCRRESGPESVHEFCFYVLNKNKNVIKAFTLVQTLDARLGHFSLDAEDSPNSYIQGRLKLVRQED